MAIKIKKTTFKLALLSLVALGFIFTFFLKFLEGDSVNLSKLESKAKQIFPSDESRSLIPTARADAVGDSGDGGSDSSDSDSGGGGSADGCSAGSCGSDGGDGCW